MALRKQKEEIEGLGRTYAAHRYAIVFYSLLLTLCAAPLRGSSPRRSPALALRGDEPSRGRVWSQPGTRTAGPARVRRDRARAPRRVRIHDRHGARIGGAHTLGAARGGRHGLDGTLRDAQRGRESRHLRAALSGYVLAGVFFGVLYAALEKAWPGSLVATGAVAALGELPLSSGIYFSFVTLATLGYGDIVPGTELTRGIAIFEAVGAQIYIAVMIARLVALYVQRKGARKS